MLLAYLGSVKFNVERGSGIFPFWPITMSGVRAKVIESHGDRRDYHSREPGYL